MATRCFLNRILNLSEKSLVVKRKMFYNKLYWKAILRMKEDYRKKDIANYVCCGVMWGNCFVAIFDAMAEIFSKILVDLDCSPYPNSSTLNHHIERHEKNDEYLKFTDRAFWAQLDNIKKENLEGYVPEYIVKMHEKLLHYQEFEMAKNGEIIITSNNKKDVCNKLKESCIYQELLSENEDRLMLFHSKGFTSQIPENEFRRILDKINLDTTSDEKFIKYNTKRLQEGVAVIEPQKSLQLLADDSRSIMSHLYGTETYILREYRIS